MDYRRRVASSFDQVCGQQGDPREASIVKHFASLPDPRVEQTKRHQLLDILVIALCGFICGSPRKRPGRCGNRDSPKSRLPTPPTSCGPSCAARRCGPLLKCGDLSVPGRVLTHPRLPRTRDLLHRNETTLKAHTLPLPTEPSSSAPSPTSASETLMAPDATLVALQPGLPSLLILCGTPFGVRREGALDPCAPRR